MGTTSNAIFTGSSQFAQDFQSIISKAVGMASLPITQLQSDLTSLQNQSTALSSINTKFAALETAMQGIQDAMGGSAYQATVSDPTKLSVTLGDGAMEGVYTVDVVDPGAYATTMTTSSWNGTGAHTYKLTFDGGATTSPLTPADNSIGSVAAAINSQYGDKVRAIVVNVGSGSAPDYRISLQAVQLGPMNLEILDNNSALPNQQTTGALAQYVVNNSGQPVSSTSRSASIANGVTVSLLAGDSGRAVSITVTRSTSALGDALSAFVDAYNAAVDEVDKQHGTTAGPLAGQALVNNLSQALSQIATYAAPGSAIGSLAGLGVSLDKTGQMTYNPFALMAADLSSASGVVNFLGSATGGGFLRLATDTLKSIEDPASGEIAATQTDLQNAITNTNNRISDKQDQVDQLQQQLLEQMSAADAAIAAMEQQYSYITGMFQAMQVADQQYK